MISDFLSMLLDLIYPERIKCLFCGAELKNGDKYYICSYCVSLLPFLSDNVCKRCGRPLKDGCLTDECHECSRNEISFNRAVSVFEYSGLIKSVLYRLKYDGERGLSAPIGLFMACKLREIKWNIDMIVPVPLHDKRISERGYNQSYLLSCEIGRELNLYVRDDLIIRNRYTNSQTSLSRLERLSNMRGAFTVVKDKFVRGKSILVVDDIMTTGATLNECSRALRDAGAEKTYCITAACPYNAK